jgi:hypothetical protein
MSVMQKSVWVTCFYLLFIILILGHRHLAAMTEFFNIPSRIF